MKTTLSLLLFLFVVTGMNAQENASTTPAKETTNEIIKDIAKNEDAVNARVSAKQNASDDMACYGEISKVTFYEALIIQNNFDIQLKDSNNHKLVLRNTEDIITNSKERISYTD